MAQPATPPLEERWKRRLLMALLILGILLTGMFGVRTVRSFMQFQGRGLHMDVTDVEAIRGWMTIPYIAKAYRVPEEYLFAHLDIPPEGNRNKSLARLIQEIAPGEQWVLIESVKAAIREYQADHPEPGRGRHD
jgi:hypothetical protein